MNSTLPSLRAIPRRFSSCSLCRASLPSRRSLTLRHLAPRPHPISNGLPSLLLINHVRFAQTLSTPSPTKLSDSIKVIPPDIGKLKADEDFGEDTELVPIEKARITITDEAIHQLNKISLRESSNTPLALRLAVESGGCHGYQYKMELTEERGVDDYVFQPPGDRCIPVIVDLISLGLLKGSTLHFATELIGSSFRLENNPQAKEGGACGCGVSWEAVI